jgi:hypothetical protein
MIKLTLSQRLLERADASDEDCRTDDGDIMREADEALKAKDAEIAKLQSAIEARWQPMDTAPLDGKHCILSLQAGSGFMYSVEGAFMQGKWMNAADIDSEPLAWMPNVRLPEELCPWTDAFKARIAAKEKANA